MKTLKLISIGLAALATVSVNAQTFAQVATQANTELKAAEKELASLRSSIANKKIPISKELTQLESEVQTERTEYDRVVSAADNVTVDLNAMEAKVKARQDENIYLRNLMASYIKQFSTRIHEAELQKYDKLISDAEQILDTNATDAEKLESQIKVIQASLERVEKIVGGHAFEGYAIGGGKEITGNYILAGPYTFFGDGGENVGFAQSGNNSIYPVISNNGLEKPVVNSIRELASQASGIMPVDPTEGNALKIAQVRETFVEHVKAGGITMVFILGLAFVALLIAIFKLFEINSVKRPKPGAIQQILDNLNGGNKQKALEIANSVDGPFGDLLVAGVEHADQDKELLEEVLYERLLAAQPKLERFLAFIALTAASAPLLGLLGTVTGMINTFKLITVYGTGDAKSLSSGISVALITTEFGLYVAIPALLAQALLNRLAKGKLGEMEQASVAFVNGLNPRG